MFFIRSLITSAFSLALLLPAMDSHAQQALGPAAFCGIPTFADQNPQGASATIWNGQPVIIIDPSQFGNPAWLQFVVAHECAHHVRGHTFPAGAWFRMSTYWATAQQELEADCWAATAVHPDAARFAANHFALSQGNSSASPGYPTGFERAATIMQCAGLQ